jgi:asparagine synthase (glutamine-hydrolysing)
LENRYQGTSSYFTDSSKRKLYENRFYKEKGRYLDDSFVKYFDKVKQKDDIVNKMLYVDTKTWLVDNQLLKTDKMTMAASIELRVPFLDYRLVELATSFPSSYKIKNGSGKYILKKSVKDILPNEIINRKKMGFPVPVNDWFSKELFPAIHQLLKDSQVSDWININSIEIILKRHLNGSEDNGKLIMSLLVFAMWEKTYLNT